MKRWIIFYGLLAGTLLAVYLLNNNRREVIEEQSKMIFELEQRDSLIQHYLQTINKIEENLAVIKNREVLIGIKASQDLQYGKSERKTIILDIQTIDELLKRNRAQLANLNETLHQSGLVNSELNAMVMKLENKIVNKEKEIAKLIEDFKKVTGEKKELENAIVTLENSVDTLAQLATFYSHVVETQNYTISTMESKLNQVYYRVDTKENLKDKNIIERKGGVLGIGSFLRLSDSIDNSEFVTEDKDFLISIPIRSDNAKLITDHPKGSYRVEAIEDSNNSRLLIINPEKFWQKSRYLVVIRD